MLQATPTPRPMLTVAGTACALGAVASGSILAVLIITQYPVKAGTYEFLAMVTATCAVGVLMLLATRRVLAGLDRLEAKVSAQRVAYLPQSPKTDGGVRYLRLAEQGEPDGIGLTPEAIAAARALARRIADDPAGEQRDAE